MKWSSILALAALAVVTSACEKHPASELPPKHGAGEHHHAETHAEKPGDEHGAKPAEHGAAAQPEPAKHEAEAKPAEAPKFFPETK